MSLTRRAFLRRGAAVAAILTSGCGAATSPALRSGAPGDPIRIGFIPVTDAASVIMAHELGLFREYGLAVTLSKESSWGNIRDKLRTGELNLAHALFGLPLAVYTGIAGVRGTELPIVMMLNANGQAITLARSLAAQVGYGELSRVGPAIDALRERTTPTFAMVFPGANHDLWVRYWLSACGVDPATVQILTVPPPQMVANMRVNVMHGYAVAEPWNGLAAAQGVGFTHLATQDLWADHPEKALAANPIFAARRRAELKLVVRAILDASAWLDEGPGRRAAAAEVLSRPAYLSQPAARFVDRMQGRYDLGAGLGERTFAEHHLMFHRGGAVNYPRAGHAIWFLRQNVRFGRLADPPDYRSVARRLILEDLYREAAREAGVPVPDDAMSPFRITLDGARFDPARPDE